MIKDVHKQIADLTTRLISCGFTIRENFPSTKDKTIVWSGHKSISHVLSCSSYAEAYIYLIENKEYNLILGDGSLIQMMYTFNKTETEIISHRLAYFPRPSDYHKISLLFDRPSNCLPVPVRFDFSNDSKPYREHFHSYSHCTLGNLVHSRVPVEREISPNAFILFILKTFYVDQFVERKLSLSDFDCKLSLNSKITRNEKKLIHFSIS